MRHISLSKEILSRILTKKLSKINLSVTFACNYRCKTCNIWKIYTEAPEQKDTELALRDYDRLFKENPELMWVSFTGGEPFLRTDFTDIVLSALNNIEKIRVVSLVTNGSMPEQVEKGVRRILDKAGKATNIFVEVSLDGVEAVHNELRGIHDAYKKALDTYLKLKDLKEESESSLLDVNLEYTISKFNIGLLKKTIDTLREANVPFDLNDLVVTFAHNSFYYRNLQNDITPQTDTLIGEISWLLDQYRSGSLFDQVTRTYLKSALKYFNGGWRPPCVAGVHSCFLDPYGNIYPCIMLSHKIGNLNKDGFDLRKILRNPNSRFFKKSLRDSCPTCWTSCEAYQTIIFNFPYFLKDLI